MKKALLVATAAAFLGTATLAPTPASAVFPFLPIALAAKVNPNFAAKAPAEKKVVKKAKKKSAKKSKKKSKKK